jgi:hypothetical protein
VQDTSVLQILDWHKQVRHFSGPARELLTHSIALEEGSGDRITLRILIGPRTWPRLTDQLRFSIGLSMGMGLAGMRRYRRITFEKTVGDPVIVLAR